MLKISLPATDDSDVVELQLEHSLVSLSKWEQVYEKPFFGAEGKTPEEMGEYLRMMVLGEEPPVDMLLRLTPAIGTSITDYINARRTGTTFVEDPSQRRASREVITSELIYHWMVGFKLPFYPCEHWHLNRLLAQIRVEGIKNAKPKKMSPREASEQMRKINEERRAKLGTSG